MGEYVKFTTKMEGRACPCCGRPLSRGNLFRLSGAFDSLYEFNNTDSKVVEFGYSEDRKSVKFYDWHSTGTIFLCSECGEHIMWLAGQPGYESELDPEEIRRAHGK